MKDIKLLVSSILILLAFFVWYTLWDQKKSMELEDLKNKKYIINLETTKTKIDIIKPDNIIIKVNWNETSSWTIDL